MAGCGVSSRRLTSLTDVGCIDLVYLLFWVLFMFAPIMIMLVVGGAALYLGSPCGQPLAFFMVIMGSALVVFHGIGYTLWWYNEHKWHNGRWYTCVHWLLFSTGWALVLAAVIPLWYLAWLENQDLVLTPDTCEDFLYIGGVFAALLATFFNASFIMYIVGKACCNSCCKGSGYTYMRTL